MIVNRVRCGRILAIAGLLIAAVGIASGEESLRGKRVLTIRSGVNIEQDGRAVCRCDVGKRLTVIEDDGERINVGVGWVRRRDVLLFDEAMRRFSQQIESDPSADHYYQRGRGYLANNEIALALLDASECLSKEPKHAHALALRGECFARTGQLQSAIDSFSDAIAVNSADANFYVGRGTIYLRVNDDERARADFDAALHWDKRIVAAHMGRGVCLFNAGQFVEATDEITKYLSAVPDDANGHWVRAMCYLATGQFEKAAADMTECIQIEPKDPSYYVKRGQIFLTIEQPAKAVADLREAIKLDADVAETHFFLGAALIKCREYAEALKALDKALALDAKLVDAHSIRALFWFNRKEFAKALSDLDAAIRIDPADSASLQIRGWLLATATDAAIRNGKQALTDARSACELTNYASVAALKCLAAAHAEVGDFGAAVEWQKKVIKLNQDEDDREELVAALRLFEQKKPLRVE